MMRFFFFTDEKAAAADGGHPVCAAGANWVDPDAIGSPSVLGDEWFEVCVRFLLPLSTLWLENETVLLHGCCHVLLP